MNVTRDDEIGLPPPPPAPTAYYMPAFSNYGPMYMPDAAYGYAMAPVPPMPAHMSPQFQDHTEIMSIIPTLRCWSCNKCGNLNYAHRLTCNLRKCQKMCSDFGNGAGEADWMCACGNVNYRFRKYCNLRKCQLPQIGNPYLFFGINHLIKSGYSSQTALSLLLTNGGINPEGPGSEWAAAARQPSTASNDGASAADAKEGCWQCTSCGNLNWPWREECNRKGCLQVKKNCCT